MCICIISLYIKYIIYKHVHIYIYITIYIYDVHIYVCIYIYKPFFYDIYIIRIITYMHIISVAGTCVSIYL